MSLLSRYCRSPPVTLQEAFGHVGKALSERSTLVRILERSSDTNKRAALMDCLDALEDLRAVLNVQGLDRRIAGSALEHDCLQWALAVSELTENVRDQLADYEVQAFSRLIEQLQSQARAFRKVIVEQNASEPLCPAASFLGHLTTGQAFWTSDFGNRFAVGFDDFKIAIEKRHPKTPERTWTQLKSSLDPHATGSVTSLRFAEFLEGFGEDLGTALEQLAKTLSEHFFAGFISYEESEALLQNCRPGHFLVRFSASRPCGLVLARKAIDNATGSTRVVQTLIISRNGGFELDGRLYKNLSDVTSAFPGERLMPAPTVRSIARTRFFKGFLTLAETEALLRPKRNGTFLFRFSTSEPGAFVVGFKENDVVKQTRVLSVPERGGYQLKGSEVYYPSIEDIVRQNQHRLKYALDDPGSSEIELRLGDEGSQYNPLADRYGGVNGLDYGRLDGLV